MPPPRIEPLAPTRVRAPFDHDDFIASAVIARLSLKRYDRSMMTADELAAFVAGPSATLRWRGSPGHGTTPAKRSASNDGRAVPMQPCPGRFRDARPFSAIR